jgi:two-component system, OmpR family, phosphate regulon sensor histidine kinase PhoR
MLKNPTPRQIAVISAGITSLACFICVLIFYFNSQRTFAALVIVVLPIICLLTSYFTVNYLIERFIYRRVKIIYKRITETKKDKRETDSVIPETLEEVEQEVEAWALGKNKQIETLQELEEYRRNYLGNVSHELKTPIFNIQGFLHTLIDGGLKDDSIKLNYLQKAARNTERLENIVNDLETISRLESKQVLLELQVFDIQQLAIEVFDDLEMQAKEKNIRLTFKDGANHGYRVHADKESIRQVLTNLIANSIKYGKKGGNTKLGFYDMDKIVLIEITDNGIGIARHHLKHLFDRFYRVDKSRSRDVGGTGLGLSIVKHIVEAHGQTVHVRSSENVGSTFGFTLEKSRG